MPGSVQESAMQQRALPSSIDDLQRAINTLEATIENLKSQLRPVLDSESLEPCDVKANGIVAPYQYAEQISDVVSRIHALNSIGTDLISRLHI